MTFDTLAALYAHARAARFTPPGPSSLPPCCGRRTEKILSPSQTSRHSLHYTVVTPYTCPNHDHNTTPQKLLASLRDHLASPDTPIAFLFGAGTSCAVQVTDPVDNTKCQPLIPDVAGLTVLCQATVAAMGTVYAQAWQQITSQTATATRQSNIEDVLSHLHVMSRAVGAHDKLVGLRASQISRLVRTIRKEIARHVIVDDASIPGTTPHSEFARWIIKGVRHLPIQVFTVNYDILIERALEAEFVPLFDGFVGAYTPFFYPESLRHVDTGPGKNWTRLWKMHGSVTWRRVTGGGHARILRGTPDPSGEMILPSAEKYDESRQQPYISFMDHLIRFLELERALLITCGFSFSDAHINSAIFGALANRPRSHLYALQYLDPGEDADLVQHSYRQRNIVVLGPQEGIVGGVRGPWYCPTVHGVFSDEIGQPGVERSPNPNPTADADGLRSGPCTMRIGDFAVFCRFLSKMTHD